MGDNFAVILRKAGGVVGRFKVGIEEGEIVFNGAGEGDAEVVFDVFNAAE